MVKLDKTKAEAELRKSIGIDDDNDINFKYDFDKDVENKLNIVVKEHSIKDIVSELKDGEKITFTLNNGKKYDPSGECVYNEEYDNSLYWEHKMYGDWIRVDSDMGSLKEWSENLVK